MKKILIIIITIFELTISNIASANQQRDKDLLSRLEILESKVAKYNSAGESSLSKTFKAIKPIGRLHVDSKFYRENNALDDKKHDGVDIKRARLGIKGKLYDGFSYKFENDFANNSSKIKDAYISYNRFKNYQLKMGQFKQPFSLEKLTSSNSITFIDRSIAVDNTPSRTAGLQGSSYGNNWQFAAGIFGESSGNEDRKDDSQYSASLRASYAPINYDGKLLHLGIASTMTFKDRNTVYDESGNATANSIDKETLCGAEFALGLKSLSLQGEYIINNTDYDKNAAGNDAPETTGKTATYDGYYIQASYILTGESRVYNPKTGSFKGVKVKNALSKGGIGAWELTARVSDNDNNGASDITNQLTFGVNWYLGSNTRLMANYITADIDEESNKEKYNGLLVRAQLNF